MNIKNKKIQVPFLFWVCGHVLDKHFFPTRFIIAFAAFERLQVAMHGIHVLFEVRLLGETAFAYVTFSFVCVMMMNSNMLFQLLFIGKSFDTIVAGIGFIATRLILK